MIRYPRLFPSGLALLLLLLLAGAWWRHRLPVVVKTPPTAPETAPLSQPADSARNEAAPTVAPAATLPPPMALEPLISPAGRQSLIAKDGTPLRMELSPGDPATMVELQAWTGEQPAGSEAPYPWKFRLTVPAGGVVERADRGLFLAPESGYQRVFDFTMPGDLPAGEWSHEKTWSFFVRFDNNTFGLLDVAMVAGGVHFATVRPHLNPATGSRHLQLPPPRPVKKR